MDKWKNYRANNVVPPGFKAVPEVFEILGRVIFDPDRWGDDCVDQWNGRECDPLATLTEAECSRRKEALLWMHKLSSAGVLRFFMLRSGGVPALVSKERWNCAGEVAEDRFLACALYSGRGNLMQRPTKLVDRADYYRRFDIPIFADDVSLMTAAKGLEVVPYGAGRSATDDMSIHIADSFLARFKAEISVEGQDENVEVAVRASEGSPPSRSKPLLTKDQTEQWYRDRKTEADNHRRRYSRPEDEAAGRLVGIGRDRVRELRNMIAPDWAKKDGRPSKAGG